MDMQGFEPWTLRMQSECAATAPHTQPVKCQDQKFDITAKKVDSELCKDHSIMVQLAAVALIGARPDALFETGLQLEME